MQFHIKILQNSNQNYQEVIFKGHNLLREGIFNGPAQHARLVCFDYIQIQRRLDTAVDIVLCSGAKHQ